MTATTPRARWPSVHPGILAAIFFALAWGLNPSTSDIQAQKFLNPPPEQVEHFHLGFKESMADSFWLRWIQDSDYCQTYLRPVLYNPQSVAEAKDGEVPRHKVCDTSWSFKMLDAVTKLAPKFKMPYLAGASTLAILVEDFAGASEIYERGIRQYPNDWQLLYRASFHYQFDVKNYVRAAELLARAGENGGPYWLKSLAGRLLTKAGQLEFALSVLEGYRESIKDKLVGEAKTSLDKRIADLKARLNRK